MGRRLAEKETYNHFDSNVPGGTIVASRSGPVEIIPISTCRKSEINFKYSVAARGNCPPSFTPYVVSPQPGSALYSGVTCSYSSASAGISFSGVPLYL